MATAPTTPPPDGPALTEPPSTADPENFDAEGDAFLGALPDLQAEMNAAKANVFANAGITYDNAVEAAASATAAATSEANAAAMANFKGLWSAQVGALNKPASVDHNGAFWGLLNNLADVTTSQPGVSADWVVVGGAWPIVPINTNTTAVPRRTYLFTGACTLTAPAITGNNKQFGLVVPPGVTGAIFAPAGADKTCGASGTQPIDAPFSVVITDSGATYGWV
ncbi:MAG: hypothetical protein V4706_01655 [Pseudomonadota bacterium]